MIHEIFAVGPLACNCSIFGDETTREAMVIDPGDDIEQILAILSEYGLKVKQIVVTHAHIDHVGGAIDPAPTRVFKLPQPSSPRAAVAVTDPDGRIRRFSIGGGGLTIGRADDNDLVARDTRVSRHHGRIAGRRGTLVYLDLGSTNGSRVNGEPVTEVVLGVGDRLEVGDTTIVVEGAGATD